MAIEVELQFCVASPASRMPAKNEVIDLVYRGCKTNGLSLAMPPESLLWGPAVAGGEPAAIVSPLSSGNARASDYK
jgi:small-conductance mechanosensitive channel